ncbi:cytochrome b561 domain-containing protein [Ceratobasidium sp. AG-Ba]|nr:cytochrome b561 domain-containing protein [Ceratobasidium sp. AG-Ba]
MNGHSERQPLLPPPQTRRDTAVDNEAIDSVLQRQEVRPQDPPLAATVLRRFQVTVAYTWYSVFIASDVKKLGFFAAHPPLQTLAVLMFAMGILTLQPTLSAGSKAAGRTRHQIYQLGLGIPFILIGSISIIYHKQKMGWAHFASLHSRVGLATLILLVLQAVAGAASLWGKGAAVGGEERGKALWKWHRLSGYIVFPMLLLTIALGGYSTMWAKFHVPRTERIIVYIVAPIMTAIALWARARIHKMPQLGFK